jgi:chloride channel 2
MASGYDAHVRSSPSASLSGSESVSAATASASASASTRQDTSSVSVNSSRLAPLDIIDDYQPYSTQYVAYDGPTSSQLPAFLRLISPHQRAQQRAQQQQQQQHTHTHTQSQSQSQSQSHTHNDDHNHHTQSYTPPHTHTHSPSDRDRLLTINESGHSDNVIDPYSTSDHTVSLSSSSDSAALRSSSTTPLSVSQVQARSVSGPQSVVQRRQTLGGSLHLQNRVRVATTATATATAASPDVYGKYQHIDPALVSVHQHDIAATMTDTDIDTDPSLYRSSSAQYSPISDYKKTDNTMTIPSSWSHSHHHQHHQRHQRHQCRMPLPRTDPDVDLFSEWTHQYSEPPQTHHPYHTRSWCERTVKLLFRRSFIPLVLAGICISCVTFGIDMLVEYSWRLMHAIHTSTHPAMSSYMMKFVLTTLYRVTLVMIAMTVTLLFAPEAAGSGIPELRAILAGGVYLPNYLAPRVLFAKIVGLALALGSGLPFGKEGPFIHISAAMGEFIHRVQWFRKSASKRLILCACAAAGIASCFNAPIGGVLFSVEVTSTFYLVMLYWPSFLAATASFLLVHLFQRLQPSSLDLFQTSFDPEPFDDIELLIFALVGAICGVLGALFVYLHAEFVTLRRRYQPKLLSSSPFGFTLIVSLILASICYAAPYLRIPARHAIEDLFSDGSLRDSTNTTTTGTGTGTGQRQLQLDSWDDGLGMYMNLIFFTLATFLSPVVAITIAVPCGVFAPMFTCGAGVGRIIGEFVYAQFSFASGSFSAASYAVVGAAALASGVTQTIASAVIVLEVTGQLSLLLPTLLAVVISTGIASALQPSIYESTLTLRGIPLLPVQPSSSRISRPHKRTAAHIMQPINDLIVTSRPSEQQIRRLLSIEHRSIAPPRPASMESSTDAHAHTDAHTDADVELSPHHGIAYTSIAADEASHSCENEQLERFLSPGPGRGRGQGRRPLSLSESDRLSLASHRHDDHGDDGDGGGMRYARFPIVASHDEPVLQGDVSREMLIQYLNQRLYEKHVSLFDTRFAFGHAVNQTPMHVNENLPLTKLYFMFHVLKPNIVYVTHNNSIVIGYVTLDRLLQVEAKGDAFWSRSRTTS